MNPAPAHIRVLSVVACALGTMLAWAAAPPLAGDVAPPGVWTLVAVDSGGVPWPEVPVQVGVADDGVTLLVDTGCERFMAIASRPSDGGTLDRRSASDRSCEGDRALAESVVRPVFVELEGIEVVAGRVVVRGAGRVLVFAPEASPEAAGIAGTPSVASSDRLDSTRFARAVDAAATNGARWVQDPVLVALLFVDEPSTGRTTIVRQDLSTDASTVVRFWFDGLRDDSVQARWYEVRLALDAGGTWRIEAARRAVRCARGSVTEVLVAGLCP